MNDTELALGAGVLKFISKYQLIKSVIQVDYIVCICHINVLYVRICFLDFLYISILDMLQLSYNCRIYEFGHCTIAHNRISCFLYSSKNFQFENNSYPLNLPA